MSDKRPKPTIDFSLAQLRYLEEAFPQVVHPPTTPEPALRHYFGGQAVVAYVRARTRGNVQQLPTPQ